MRTLHDGTQVDNDIPVGMDTIKCSRLDNDGTPLPGHGVYALSGTDLQVYTEGKDLYLSKELGIHKDKKKAELKDYYNSPTVRELQHNNHTLYANKAARDGTTELRARLKDNIEVNECTWYYDDGSLGVFDLAGVTDLNKKIIDKDQKLRRLKYAHSNTIEALTTKEEVSVYDYMADVNNDSWIGV